MNYDGQRLFLQKLLGRKPHIRRCEGAWLCTYHGRGAFGWTPKAAWNRFVRLHGVRFPEIRRA